LQHLHGATPGVRLRSTEHPLSSQYVSPRNALDLSHSSKRLLQILPFQLYVPPFLQITQSSYAWIAVPLSLTLFLFWISMQLIIRAQAFAVHVLHDGNKKLSNTFAAKVQSFKKKKKKKLLQQASASTLLPLLPYLCYFPPSSLSSSCSL